MSWNIADRALVSWLGTPDTDIGWCGYETASTPDAVWLLHAMYEHDSAPSELTYNDVRQHRLAAGSKEPFSLPGLAEIDARSVEIGSSVGRSRHPGPGWRRLRWAELADRLGEQPVPEGMLPCYRCLPGATTNGSWPVSIRPPAEGSLDRESWHVLLEVLTACSPRGAATPCVAYFGPGASGEFDTGITVSGPLGSAAELYDHPGGQGSPSNLWAADRSWITWSDWDLWGTKVTGPPEVVAAVLGSSELEGLRLSWG
ncbi:hypothetical protein ABZ319_31940 [Nocardia sp. NPDC005978]|uniref:hypothetical protein n=1 Tax=Nocardia sp. NPDC005978 TaxID=3156725 RepID=UPI0033AA6E75